MRFTLNMSIGNAAFESERGGHFDALAVADVLRRAANVVEGYGDLRHGHNAGLRDPNGNHIGEWRIELDD